MKITANVFVDAIEPCLEFWVGRLGFEKTIEVPEEGRLGFVILQHGGAELMLQTRSSVRADVSAFNGPLQGEGIALFIEVDDFDDILARLEGIEPIVPVRTTFYGMKELLVRDPAGNPVCFAARIGLV